MTEAATRYRCTACGNLTRFDLTVTRRTLAFHHYSIGGEVSVEQEDVLDERIEDVSCRWCSSGDAVEVLHIDAPELAQSQGDAGPPGEPR